MRLGKSKKFKKLDDKDLLLEFPHSSTLVLAELFERYRTLTYGLCLKYLKNREQAKDAVSGIYLKLSKDLLSHDVQHFRSWFYVYSKNYCLGLLRKMKTESKITEQWKQEIQVNFSAPDFSDADLDRLHEAMVDLQVDQRTCISQFYFERKSYKEIAKDRNYTEKKVKSLLQNGKRNLRLKIEKSSHSNETGCGL